ncbi:MAG: DUF262 domain-containing protein [Gemmataceae bacterium]
MNNITIREILDQVLRGQIRIPAFQRGFVWEPDRVAYLMDSIYKGYPFGSLLFWRTRETLRIERDLGPFKLPEPLADYPVDYVLDGQQRLTSIFGVFQTELPVTNQVFWQQIYFDFQAEDSAQDTQFVALSAEEVDAGRYFPLNALFDTVAYRKATRTLSDETAKRVDDMQAVFKETLIPVQTSDTKEKATVAIIFERVNRQGVPLDTLQLLSAWTWSEEFQIQEQFADLTEQLAPFGFEEIGGDTNLLLRCCAAVLAGDASPDALMNLKGPEVRENFGKVLNGVKYAVDYLRQQFNVHSLGNLPFPTVLVPLSVFFAVEGSKEASYSDDQRKTINKWFWRTAFSKRYSSGVLRNLKADIDGMALLRSGGKTNLGQFSVSITPDFFTENDFGMGNVNTKTFILMLAQHKPLSFISGTPVSLATTLKESNRTEFHHLMPRAFLQKSDQVVLSESVLANFCFLSRTDNRQLGGVAPSKYKSVMAANVDEILTHALCPKSLFKDKFEVFVSDRSKLLATKALELCK